MAEQHRQAALARTRKRDDYQELLDFLRPVVEGQVDAKGLDYCLTEGGRAHPDFVAEIIEVLKEDRATSYNPNDWTLPYKGALRKRWFEDVIVVVLGDRRIERPTGRVSRPMSDLDKRRAGLPVSNLPVVIDLSDVHCGWGR